MVCVGLVGRVACVGVCLGAAGVCLGCHGFVNFSLFTRLHGGHS